MNMSFDPVTISIVKVLNDRHRRELVFKCWRTMVKKSDKKREDKIYDRLRYLIEFINLEIIYVSPIPDYESDFMEMATSLYPETMLKMYMRVRASKYSLNFRNLLRRAVDYQMKDRGIWYNFYGENL